MRSRMPVQKEDGEAGPAMPHTDLAMRGRYEPFREVIEEVDHRLFLVMWLRTFTLVLVLFMRQRTETTQL